MKWWLMFFTNSDFKKEAKAQMEFKFGNSIDKTFNWLKQQIDFSQGKIKYSQIFINMYIDNTILGSLEENGLVQMDFISSDMEGIDKKLQVPQMKVILKSKKDLEVLSLTLVSWNHSVAVHKLIVFTPQEDIRKVEKFFAARNFVLLHH